MATFLFNDIIFGPINSRRLGLSLGVNLLQTDNKICNFDCIYCECGWNGNTGKIIFPSAKQVIDALDFRLNLMLKENTLPDIITFAGNGEPTIHPDFSFIINETILLKEKYCPSAKVAVLTNATMLHSESVVNALLRVDRAILKLDSAIDSTRQLINIPSKKIPIDLLIKQFSQFGDKLVIQTLFLEAKHNGNIINNTSEIELQALFNVYKLLKPSEIMIYCIDRDTPLDTIFKIPSERLDQIAERIRLLDLKVSVSY